MLKWERQCLQKDGKLNDFVRTLELKITLEFNRSFAPCVCTRKYEKTFPSVRLCKSNMISSNNDFFNLHFNRKSLLYEINHE